MNNTQNGLPRLALFLGYGGLIPFVSLACTLMLHVEISILKGFPVGLFLAIYAAVIISFLGAIHWGVVIAKADELSQNENNILLIYSVIPSLLACISFVFTAKVTLLSLSILVLICFLVDHLILFKKLELKIAKDFSRLRLHLALVVSLSLFVAAMSLSS